MNQRPEVFLIEFLGGLRPNTEVMGRKEQVMPRYADPEDGVIKVDPKSIDVDEYRNPDAPYMGPFIEEQEKYRFLLSPRSPLAQSFEIRQIPKELTPQQVREINRRVIPNYDEKRERLRRGLLAPLL